MRPLFYLLILLAASACHPAPVLSDAPAFATYTPEQQKEMTAAFDALPKDSPLRPALQDCRALRHEIRAGR